MNKLKIIINCYGAPSEIGSDNGKEFKNSYIEKYLKENIIKFLHSNRYYLHSQGVVERFHQTIKDMLYEELYEKVISNIKNSFKSIGKTFKNFSLNELVLLNPKFLFKKKYNNKKPGYLIFNRVKNKKI